MTRDAHVAYIILTWNSEKCISKCLEAISSINAIKQTIIIVDNASKDDTLNIIKTFEERFAGLENHKLDILQLKENRGTTVSRNLGLERVPENVEYICILDSDTQINEISILNMIRVLDENVNNAIVGPVMQTIDGNRQISGRRIPTATMKILKAIPIKALNRKAECLDQYCNSCAGNYPVGYLMSACWLIKKAAMIEIGKLDENIFYAPEDVEYCIRAWKKGWRVIYCQEAEIIHEWQRISKKKVFSKHNWEHVKGLLYLYCKYSFFFRNKSIEKLVR